MSDKITWPKFHLEYFSKSEFLNYFDLFTDLKNWGYPHSCHRNRTFSDYSTVIHFGATKTDGVNATINFSKVD